MLLQFSHDRSFCRTIIQTLRLIFVYFPTCQVSTPQKAVLHMYRFNSFFLKYKSNLLVKRVLLNVLLPRQYWVLFQVPYPSCMTCFLDIQIFEISTFCSRFYLSQSPLGMVILRLLPLNMLKKIEFASAVVTVRI